MTAIATRLRVVGLPADKFCIDSVQLFKPYVWTHDHAAQYYASVGQVYVVSGHPWECPMRHKGVYIGTVSPRAVLRKMGKRMIAPRTYPLGAVVEVPLTALDLTPEELDWLKQDDPQMTHFVSHGVLMRMECATPTLVGL